MHNSVDLCHVDILQLAARPADAQRIDVPGGAETESDRQLDLGQVAARRHHLAALRGATGFQFDHGTDCIAVGRDPFKLYAQPVLAGRQFVAQQYGTAAVLGNGNIEITIAIDVGIGGTTTDHRMRDVARRLHLLKAVAAGITAVPEQLRGLGVGLAGLHKVDIGLQMAVGLEQVEPAVEVVVEEEQPEGQCQSRGRSKALP